MIRFVISFFILFLCSCSTTASNLPNSTKPPLNVPNVAPLKMEPVAFKVIHKDNAQTIFDGMEKQNKEPVLIGLTGQDYKSLSINMDSLKKFIILQRKIINMYKEYYEGKQNE